MSTKRILGLFAHPDDAEIKIGGTLLLFAKKGWEVHIATCSQGDCGSATQSPNEIAVIRRAEAIKAAEYAGGKYHCLGGTDLHIYDDDFMRGAATTLIREIDPDLIITHFPIDYMPDHTAASAVARTAVFTAPMPNFIYGTSASAKITNRLIPLYYVTPLGGHDFFDNPIEADFCVDITSVADDKANMLGCHESQREWLRKQHGIDQYIEEMREWDAQAGEKFGVKYGEQFILHKGHAYPRTPIIEETLADFIRKP